METEPQVVFEHFEPAANVRARIDSEIAKLNSFFDRIISCRVAVKAATGRRQQGDLYDVSVHLVLPEGREVAAHRNPTHKHAYDDVNLAIRDAFKAARRQLQDEVRKLRGDVKVHEGPPMATVKTVIAGEDYGFLETDDRREIYFHRNSVTNGGFDRIVVGDRVSFHESLGDKGPQASTVRVVSRGRQRDGSV
jgi:cold shock CspA family protein/ribosome-associated translation inhibitor RaiA